MAVHIIYITILFALVIFITIYYTRSKKASMLQQKTLKEEITFLNEELDRFTSKNNTSYNQPNEELTKVKGKVAHKKFNLATVLFSDIEGFTKLAEKVNSEVLIDMLDDFFFHFDSVVEKYNIEKIKTIGDAYMCAGGIPIKNRTNPIDVIMAALEMQTYMKKIQLKNTDSTNNPPWKIRIGIHTGPVITGVVGHKKVSYDIWGDSVNVASRMESSGEADKINISETTYMLIKDFFDCDPRGKIPVKYKGNLKMYFVKGLKPSMVDHETGLPNSLFHLNMQILRLDDIEEITFVKLNKSLPKELLFHDLSFFLSFYTEVEVIARGEQVSLEQLLVIRTTALIYNLGFTESYQNSIEASKKVAKQELSTYHYSQKQIEKVIYLLSIMKFDEIPTCIEGKILFDAYFSFISKINSSNLTARLKSEIAGKQDIEHNEQWWKEKFDFIEKNNFLTETARVLTQQNIE